MKCAGTSLERALGERVVGTEYIWERLHPYASAMAAEQLGRERLDLRGDLVRYFLCHPAVYVLSGEFRFEPWMPAEFGASVAFVTMVREPVSHLLSYYRYFSDPVRRDDPRYGIRGDLREFVASPRALLAGAHFVERLCGSEFAADITAPEAISAAVGHLAHFDLVGRVEATDELCARFEALFGVRLTLPRVNQTRVRPELEPEALDSETLDRIHVATRPNRAVYQAAARRHLDDPVPSEPKPG
jgi:hypothetical protein